jgi:GDP-L-fucose synthase
MKRMTDFWQDKKVVVTGGSGFLGSHLVDALHERDNEPFIPRSFIYDLRTQDGVERMFDDAGPVDVLFNLAAEVGGIGYNQAHAYTLFHANAMMGVQVIHEAIRRNVKKFVQVGTVCAYPKYTPVPFRECNLWEGYPEETNAPYGLAKRLLLVQLQAARAEYGFNGIYLMPTNLYGPRDKFDPVQSHVVPALIRKFVEARDSGAESVTIWGTGNASRDFLYVSDAVNGLLMTAERYDRPEPLNLGSGQEIRIDALARLISDIVGFEGDIRHDVSKPDGQPRRCLDSSAALHAIGWKPQVGIRTGIEHTVRWYEEALRNGTVYNEQSLREVETCRA